MDLQPFGKNGRMSSQLTFKVVWSKGDVMTDDDCKFVSLNYVKSPSLLPARAFVITNRPLAEKERFSFFVDNKSYHVYRTCFGLVEPDTEYDFSSWEKRLGEWCTNHEEYLDWFLSSVFKDFPGNVGFWDGFEIGEKDKIIKAVEAPLSETEDWLSICNDEGILTFTWNRSEERIPCHARAAFGFLLVSNPYHNTTTHVQVSNVQSVPVEIRERGGKAVRAFEKAWLEGTVHVHRGRVMIIGQDGAGKTSLMKSLLGLPFKGKEGSTVGLEVVTSKLVTLGDNLAKLKPSDCKQLAISMYQEDVAQLIRGGEHEVKNVERKKEEAAAVVVGEEEDSKEEEDDDMDKQDKQEQQVEEGEEDDEWHKQNIQNPVVTTERANAIDIESVDLLEGLKGFKKLLDARNLHRASKPIEAVVNIWDFAGQEVYYATHPAFLAPQAVYLLAYNLSKDLNKVAEPSARIKSDKIPLENPNKATNLDNFLSWLVSVHSIRTKEDNSNKEEDTGLGYLRPPVLVVCTHADRPFEDIETMTSHIQESIEGKRYSKHVIRPLYVVDNRRKSKKYHGEISSLTAKIRELLDQEPQFSQAVPMRWFEFEKVCKALVEKGIFHLNQTQLEATLHKSCNLKDVNDITAMLDYYQDIGLIIKHGSTVVLKPEWLIDLFRRLITIPSFDKTNALFADCWRELARDGILTEKLFNHVFDEFLKQGLPKDDILDMMEIYGLIAKFSKSEELAPGSNAETYFVPCLLKLPPNSLTSIVPSDFDPCPMYIHFPDGFLPHGLFPQIVSRLIAWCSSNGHPGSPRLFQNGARFFVGKKSTNNLILVSKKCFIKVVVKRTSFSLVGSSEDSDVADSHLAYDLRLVLKEILERLTRERVWLRNITWEECIMCPNSSVTSYKCLQHETLSDDHDTCFHLIPVQRGDRLVCDRSIDGHITCPGLDRWFLPEDEQEADECDKSRSVRAVEVLNDLQQLTLDAKQSGEEVDLLNDLKRNAGNEGFVISNNRGGGNCMFYSLAEQLQLVKGNSISHDDLRRELVAFLEENPRLANGTDLFNFIAEYSSWTDYLRDMAKDGTWGDHVVLVAAANCFQVPIHVISSLRNRQNSRIRPESPVSDTTPLVLGHVHELHYVSLRPLQDEGSVFLDEAACLPAHGVPTWPSLPAQGGRVEESMQPFDPKDPDTIRLRESPYLAQTSRPIKLDVRRHLPTPKVKEGTPTDEELEELAGEIGGSWEKLGRRLHFSEAKITGFDRENVLYCEKPFKMLLGWKQRDGPNASYQVLYDALCHDLVGRKDLARTFLTQ